MKAKDYNLKWQDYFEYDESSPSGLVWVIPRVFNGTLNYDRVGNPAGSKSKFYEKTNTSEGYRACVIDHNGVKYRKYFSILKYGEDAKFLAEDWKTNRLEELENAGFTDRHGKEIFQQ